MKVFLTVLLLLGLLVLANLIGAQNDQFVTVKYLIAQSEMRLSVLMAVMLLLGILLSFTLFSLFWLRLKWRIRQLERKQKALANSPQA